MAALTASPNAALDMSALTALSLSAIGTVDYSSALTLNGTVYRLGGGGTLIFETSLSSGSLAVKGAATGSVIFTGTNSHAGGTTISSGTL